MNEPTLAISFTYDHASGTFRATLENGASFTVERTHIGGRLENALTLFKNGVINSSSGRWRQAPKRVDFEYSYDETDVKRFSENGRPKLPPLELELGEL